MSDLIPEINWIEFVKIVKAGRIEELKSCEVKFNGSLIFTAIIPHGDFITKDYARVQAEYLGQKSNIPGGLDPEEVKNNESLIRV